MAAAAIVGSVALGCGERHRVDHRVWSLFQIRAAFDSSEKIGVGPTMPEGMPPSSVLDSQPDGTFTLKPQPCFAEGAPAAYVTTEVWVNYYDEVWLEPFYVQVVDPGNPPTLLRDEDNVRRAPAIIDVGPESTFYSPFWLVSWAVVGNVAPETYKTSRELFAAGVPMIPAGPRSCPLRPADVVATPPEGHLKDPTFGIELEDIRSGEAWFDDEGTVLQIGTFDFGANLFAVEDEGRGGIVEALPLFLFAVRDSSGGEVLLTGEPRVAGVGPLGSGKTAEVAVDPVSGRPEPRFGGLWRVHLAHLPPGAGPFHAAEHPAAATAAGATALDYEGRVALEMTCFNDAAFPAGCRWLDSQEKIEMALGLAAIAPTEITASAAFVMYGKKPVKH